MVIDNKKLKLEGLNRISVNEFKKTSKNNICIVLDDIRSAYNVGSIFRTSDAFLIDKLYLCGITPTPPNRELLKTALGAEDSVNWQHYQNVFEAIQDLKNKGYSIISIEQVENSVFLNEFKIKKNEKYAFIFGNEINGVNQKLIDISDTCIEIHQFGTKHSFNVSVCAGIVIWEFLKKK